MGAQSGGLICKNDFLSGDLLKGGAVFRGGGLFEDLWHSQKFRHGNCKTEKTMKL